MGVFSKVEKAERRDAKRHKAKNAPTGVRYNTLRAGDGLANFILTGGDAKANRRKAK